MHGYLGAYAVVGLLVVLGALVGLAGLVLNRLLRPRRPTPEKALTYESGVDPVGTGWAQAQVRYYFYAFLYVVFAVDAVYLLPWAPVFALPGFGVAALVEMGVFLGVLGLGLLYAWRRGVLTWL